MALDRTAIKPRVTTAVETHLLAAFDLPAGSEYDAARAIYATIAAAVADGVDEALAAIVSDADVSGVVAGGDTVTGAIS